MIRPTAPRAAVASPLSGLTSWRPPMPVGPIQPIPLAVATTRRKVPGPDANVVIIGAGLSGLTAAIRIAGSGRTVTVIERSDHVGGRAATETIDTELGQVRVDTGATVLTMPSLIDAALAAAGLHPTDVSPDYKISQLTPAYHAFFSSCRDLKVYADKDLMANELQRFSYAKGLLSCETIDGYRKFRRWSEDLYNATIDNFIDADFDSIIDLFSTPDAASDLARVVRLGGLGSLEKGVKARIKDDELARVFSFQALYAGVPPRQARAVYATISHMDTGQGVYYPTDGPNGPGMGALCDVLADGVRAVGGTIELNTEVTGLRVHGDRIVGVNTSNGDVKADVVIATCDLPVLQKITGRKYHRRLRWSPSAVVMHGALPADVARSIKGEHHTISFGDAWDDTFKEISAPHGRGQLMTDPSLLITRPAFSAPSMGSGSGSAAIEPISILAPCPNLESRTYDWTQLGPAYCEDILALLEHRGFTGIRESFALGRIDTPLTWHQQGLGAGTPFAAAHLFSQTGPFRTRNFPVLGFENLVLAGSTTTPGVGVPTAIMSGSLAARRITEGGVR